MGLNAGTRLGPYEIFSAIGAGGMGEVYRARDTRLDRIVAIKVLPTHLADRSELRERFEREARTIASLNHPHICTLFDIGEQDGIDYLVMEYLEGETLAHRLLKGPMPLPQVLQFAIEIADALDKAHRRGVTHRDLKPGNIMLTKTGTKLLDFGLAKLKQEVAPANVQLSQLPTANDPLTAQGLIVGTLQYMAPEQLEGKDVDARTDIFAFGAVVYEMATGKRAFEGKSQASLIAAILDREPPPMSSLQPMTPPALDRVVKKCLAKEAENRWQTPKDLCDELKWIAGDAQSLLPSPGPAKAVRALGRRPLILGLSALLLVAGIASIATWNLKPTSNPTKQVTRTVINLPPGDQLAIQNYYNPVLALSRDGTKLAYVATRGLTQQIYLRPMDSPEAKPIPDTDGAINPFFSPSGQWIGFFAGGKLKKVSVSGGAAITLADAAVPRGASWASDSRIVFAPNVTGVIEQVSDGGGAIRPLMRFNKGEFSQRWPEFLPDGKTMLFGAGGGAGLNWEVAVKSATGERRKLVAGGLESRYAPSGHLIYVQAGTLMAAPFDAQRLELTGTAIPVVENVLQSALTGASQYTISDTGLLAYIGGGVQSARQAIVWVSRNGTQHPLTGTLRAFQSPRLSPDGRRVALHILEQDTDVWLYEPDRDTMTRLTFGGTANEWPVWTPDDKRIVFWSNRDGPFNLYWQLADGGGGPERLTSSDYLQTPNSFSPDGQLLAFTQQNPTAGYENEIWILRLSDHKVEPFLRAPFNVTMPRFSPDGRWLAYASDESGRLEVYIQPYPGTGGKSQISTEGGTEPVWNRNGRELFFRSGDKMRAVNIATESGFAAGKPKVLFSGEYVPAPFGTANYDVSPDGQSFLMIKPSKETQAAPTQINVVLNWFEELKQKVPTGKN